MFVLPSGTWPDGALWSREKGDLTIHDLVCLHLHMNVRNLQRRLELRQDQSKVEDFESGTQRQRKPKVKTLYKICMTSQDCKATKLQETVAVWIILDTARLMIEE